MKYKCIQLDGSISLVLNNEKHLFQKVMAVIPKIIQEVCRLVLNDRRLELREYAEAIGIST